MPLFPIFSLVLYFNSRSDNVGEVITDDSTGDDGNPVKIEDLYSDNSNRKKRLNKKDEAAPPSVEDLTP
jgi:hypothetical protein